MPGFKKNELYLSIFNGKIIETFHYQVRYAKQRCLVVELISFAKRLAEKNTNEYSEKMINPCSNPPLIERTPEKIVQNMLGLSLNQNSESKMLKLFRNDRITPAKQLFQCEVLKKNNNLLSVPKKMWLHIGVSQILISM